MVSNTLEVSKSPADSKQRAPGAYSPGCQSLRLQEGETLPSMCFCSPKEMIRQVDNLGSQQRRRTPDGRQGCQTDLSASDSRRSSASRRKAWVAAPTVCRIPVLRAPARNCCLGGCSELPARGAAISRRCCLARPSSATTISK